MMHKWNTFRLITVGIIVVAALLGMIYIDQESAEAAQIIINKSSGLDIGDVAYVPMGDTNSMALIDIQTHSTVGTIDMAQYGCIYPQRARLTPDGAELYVTCDNSNIIVILDTTDLSLVDTIDRPGVCLQDVTFVQDGAYALASTTNCGGIYQIDVIDTAIHSIVQSIPTSDYSIMSITAHPYLSLAYAAAAGSVLVIDTITFTVQTIISIDGLMFGVQPSPDGNWVYASDNLWVYPGVYKIDTHTNAIAAKLPLGESAGIQVSPDGSTLFVAAIWGTVNVIDAINFSLITSIGVGGNISEMALTCDGSELYIARDTTSIPVIDTQTYTITYDISIPGTSSGYGIAICPQRMVEGSFLNPPAQAGFALAEETITYTLQIYNLTEETDSFDVEILPGNDWTTSLSTDQVGPIQAGESITFTAWVDVPVGAQPGTNDTAIIQATSVTSPPISSQAALKTKATSGQLAYVPMGNANGLAVVDRVLHESIGTLNVAQYGCYYPLRTRLTPDGNDLYVMCENSHNIVILETTDFSLVATVDRPGASQQDLTFVQFGAYALVSSYSTPLDVIDTATHTIIQSIDTLGFNITSIATHPYLPTAYAGGTHDIYAPGGILVIDTNNFTVRTIILYDSFVRDVQPSPDGRWVYASEYYGNGLAKIDTYTNLIVDTLPGYGKSGLDISPDGSVIYASEGGDGVINVINAVSMEYITTIIIGTPTYESELTCDGSELYVARESTSVPVVDTQTYNISYDVLIPGASTAYGIAICPQYVAEGVLLSPTAQSGFAQAGVTATYTLQVINMTGDADSFALDVLPGNTWTTNLSIAQVGPIEDGESITFTAWVEVPPGVHAGDVDIATIQAVSVNSSSLTDTAMLNTTSASGEYGYGTLSNFDMLALIDTHTHATLNTVDLSQFGCDDPQRARLTLDSAQLYVMCEGSKNIIILDTTDLSLVTTIARPGTCGQDIAFVQQGAYALASTSDCEGIYQIDVIDTATFTVIKSIPTINYPVISMATHPFLPRAYAVGTQCCWTGAILLIDTESFTVQTIISGPSTLMDVQSSQDGKWIYAIEYGWWGSLLKIDAHTYNIVGDLPIEGQEYTNLQITPDGSKIFVAGDNTWAINTIFMVNAINMSLINSIEVGGINSGMELNCDGRELYVANRISSMPVIDTRFNTIPHHVDLPLGSSPYGVAICPQHIAPYSVFLPVLSKP